MRYEILSVLLQVDLHTADEFHGMMFVPLHGDYRVEKLMITHPDGPYEELPVYETLYEVLGDEWEPLTLEPLCFGGGFPGMFPPKVKFIQLTLKRPVE